MLQPTSAGWKRGSQRGVWFPLAQHPPARWWAGLAWVEMAATIPRGKAVPARSWVTHAAAAGDRRQLQLSARQSRLGSSSAARVHAAHVAGAPDYQSRHGGVRTGLSGHQPQLVTVKVLDSSQPLGSESIGFAASCPARRHGRGPQRELLSRQRPTTKLERTKKQHRHNGADVACPCFCAHVHCALAAAAAGLGMGRPKDGLAQRNTPTRGTGGNATRQQGSGGWSAESLVGWSPLFLSSDFGHQRAGRA